MSFSEFFSALFGDESIEKSVILNIRLPRMLVVSLCGGILGLCGVALQGLFKNPLVDPKIIGVSTGSAFGGCLALLFGLSGVYVVASSFTFGILAFLLLFFIANFVKDKSIFTLILSGIIINGFFGALISLTQYLADNEDVLPNIVFWLMGSFVGSSYDDLKLLFFIASPCIVLLLMMRWQFNLLSLDEKELKALGINSQRIKISVLVLTTILIATQVSISGNIGWIGLVVPHMARLISGANHTDNVLVSFVVGMIFLLLVDNIARTLTQSEIPIDIICALVGTPIFAYLLKRNFRNAT
ncbi:MAG: iron ABC transporter permease [Campylobacteraceae bacterium]|nr:iron ABC transporter permease [Campylobacteraceae bacterium]